MNNAQHSTRNPQDEVLVRVEGVSKKFCRSLKKSLWYGLCDIASELNPRRSNELQAGGCKLEVANAQSATRNASEAGLLQPAIANPQLPPPLRPGEFWAVNDVSFELRRGECLGLIGHNGAGKTTLLKMLNGLIKPDAGKITMRGRVGALIALGAGFNPILTGRENIYINGSVLGLSKKEIDGKIDEIIDFAELREFIEMPVQSYSSGMAVRLGFAVATSLNPDVLILDEVLAVGDESFRLKCFERVGRLLSGGVAGILVSHHMANIERTCSRCIVMSHGAALMNTTDIREAVEKYMSLQQKAYGKAEIHHHPQSPLRIRDIIVGEDRRTVDLQIAQTGQATTQVLVSYALQHKGVEVVRATTRTDEMEAISVAGGKIRMRIPDEVLRLGKLRLDFSLWDLRERISLVAVRNVVLEASGSPGYRLSFETVGSGD